MYPRNRNLLDNPPPADWDICHKNGETLYRCPAFIKYKGTGEVRRCTICKKKSKWEEHLKGQHKFNISEIEDDPMMINKTRERIEKKRSSQHTHTQCVLHIIRLRLIIFHTPKIFTGEIKQSNISTHKYIEITHAH